MKHLHLPCYVSGAAEWLMDNIKGADMWEWGCGASTLFYARLAGHVISVEHSPVWHFLIERELKVLGLDEKVDLKLIEPVLEESNKYEPRYYTPDSYLSLMLTDDKKVMVLKDYVNSINENDYKYDFITIDGRARASCIKQAVKHVKPGGYILLDDSERMEYQSAMSEFLPKEPVIEFSSVADMQKTTIWRVE
jgi:tRNA A58 N-methylase Trm61